MGGAPKDTALLLVSLISIGLVAILPAISVEAAPSLSLSPHPNVTFRVNDQVTLDCQLTDGNPTHHIQWYINETHVNATVDSSTTESQLQLLGALEYDDTSVTCAATGIPMVSNVSTQLILQRDIMRCFIRDQEDVTVCFICTLADEAHIIQISYQFNTAIFNEVVHTENLTTTIGKQEFEKCVTTPASGIYNLYVYVVDSFSESDLRNPAFVLSNITVVADSTNNSSTPTPGTTDTTPTDSNQHFLLTLRTWRYRLYVYIGAGLVVGSLVIAMLVITACILVLIKQNAPVDPYNLSNLDPINNPFHTSGTGKGKKKNKNTKGGRTSVTTTTSHTSSTSIGSYHSHTHTEIHQHHSSFSSTGWGEPQPQLETIMEDDGDNVSVYDQLTSDDNRTYEPMDDSKGHEAGDTYEPMDGLTGGAAGNMYTNVNQNNIYEN